MQNIIVGAFHLRLILYIRYILSFLSTICKINIGTSFFWTLNTAFFFYFIQSIHRLTYYLLVVVQSCQYKWRILTGKISIECTYTIVTLVNVQSACVEIYKKKPKYFQQVKNISIIMGTMHTCIDLYNTYTRQEVDRY